MYFQPHSETAKKVAKIRQCDCKTSRPHQVTIPDSWKLTELQRNFIDSMIEKKDK